MKVGSINYRTIWPDGEDRGLVRIIDQRQLPHRFVIEDLRSVGDVETAIRDMHVRGAGLIGASAAFGMHLAAHRAPEADFDAHMGRAAKRLTATRPTARNLGWAVERQLKSMAKVQGIEEKRATAFHTACEIADEDAEFCRLIGERGRPLIEAISRRKNGDRVNILTHCNAGWLAFVDYGSATAPIYATHHAGLPVHVWVDETRPWNQGAKLTAWELGEEGVPHTLIADNTGGHLMQRGMVDMVIVGSDRTTRCGDVANKIGTYLKAVAAKDCGVPFYVALPSSTFDWQIRDGHAEIPIEERSGEELKYVSGTTTEGREDTVLIAPQPTPALNYAFDVTPARLVDALITERGIIEPEESAILSLYPEFR
jgi:methylthioribose-1-phosphate isomerase